MEIRFVDTTASPDCRSAMFPRAETSPFGVSRQPANGACGRLSGRFAPKNGRAGTVFGFQFGVATLGFVLT
jgi:hypothetical protein